jgi:transcriptional regulator with XRE-family HTH domain
MGLTQHKFAQRLGIVRATLANYEIGRCRVPGDVLLKALSLRSKR